MTWYLLLRLAGRWSASSSSGMDGMPWLNVLPAVALPRFLVGESGVGRSIATVVVGVGAADRIGAAGAGVEVDGPSASRWSLGDFGSSAACTEVILPLQTGQGRKVMVRCWELILKAFLVFYSWVALLELLV
ncbi:hypothetical protein GQ457_07G007910 [Hibiscus cannabinus]